MVLKMRTLVKYLAAICGVSADHAGFEGVSLLQINSANTALTSEDTIATPIPNIISNPSPNLQNGFFNEDQKTQESGENTAESVIIDTTTCTTRERRGSSLEMISKCLEEYLNVITIKQNIIRKTTQIHTLCHF